MKENSFYRDESFLSHQILRELSGIQPLPADRPFESDSRLLPLVLEVMQVDNHVVGIISGVNLDWSAKDL